MSDLGDLKGRSRGVWPTVENVGVEAICFGESGSEILEWLELDLGRDSSFCSVGCPFGGGDLLGIQVGDLHGELVLGQLPGEEVFQGRFSNSALPRNHADDVGNDGPSQRSTEPMKSWHHCFLKKGYQRSKSELLYALEELGSFK